MKTTDCFVLLQNCASFQNELLSRIDSDLMQAKKNLVDITEPRRLCLEELGLRRHFVKWVKDALEGTCRHYRLCFSILETPSFIIVCYLLLGKL